VTGDGDGLVSHAGVAWLAETADLSGLTTGLSTAMAGVPQRRHDPGRTLAQMVLEEMMQAATGSGAGLVAEVSVRSLAGSLGLAKGTVTRAVRRPRDVGVIEVEQRRSERGVFQAGVYRLAVPTACLAIGASTTQRSRCEARGTEPTSEGIR
jgi:hypothetical protein